MMHLNKMWGLIILLQNKLYGKIIHLVGKIRGKMAKKFDQKKCDMASDILLELYKNIDEIFLSYFISLAAPQVWRPHVAKYEETYQADLKKEGLANAEIENRLAEQDHVFSIDGFQIQTNTKKIRVLLSPGYFENLQAKNAIKLLYDTWESYRPKLEKLIGDKIQSDIWGDLGHLRQSIAHRNSRAIKKLKNAKKIKDFIPGQEIILTQKIMRKIGEELENWYTEFFQKYFPRQ
jgi:hypothetical protein